MAVFWDKTVPIPNMKGITINRGDNNKVLFVKEAPYDAKAGYAKPKRNTIGYVSDNDVKQMHPTTGYKLIFPELWGKQFGEKVPAVYKHVGMYAVTELINEATGIKDIMDECFGVTYSNVMVDFAMYSLLFHTSVAEHFGSRMANQQVYSGKHYSDSYLTELFNKKIAYDDILLFKKKWALQCREDGVENVWLCIDGSNDDCASKGVILGEKGHAKSHRNCKIVSFTYAVTENGKPVTFELYRGGLVDSKAMRRIVSFLEEAGIHICGVILDRGYCDGTSMEYMASKSIPYVIMVKGTPDGFKEIHEEYGKAIRLNARYLVRGTCLFGIQKKVQLFKNYKHDDHLTLFYDFKNGGERLETYINKMNKEISRMEELLKNGEDAKIKEQYKNVLRQSEDKMGVEIIEEGLQKVLDEKGMYSIVSSEDLAPQEIHSLYQARNSSETEYSIVKSQLGYGKVRIHATKGVHTKFAIAFIASCIRYELQELSKDFNRTTNELIREMNMLSMTKIGESYVPVQGITGKQMEILEKLGDTDILNQVAKDENDRIAGRHPTPRHRKTGPKKQKQKSEKKKASGTGRKQKTPDNTKKKPGVPKGTKRGGTKKDGTPRKKPGVPVGYKRGTYNKDGSLRKKPGPKTNV